MGATMTTRALARKLKRLESLAKMRPGWNDTADASPPVVLPPVEEFRLLPLDEFRVSRVGGVVDSSSNQPCYGHANSPL
jgi:hypothetical protein